MAKKAKKVPEPPAPIPGEGTPEGDKLRKAVHAFEAGDFVQVRALTGELGGIENTEVRDAALVLRGRISIDPVQVAVLSACTAVLATIVYVWIL